MYTTGRLVNSSKRDKLTPTEIATNYVSRLDVDSPARADRSCRNVFLYLSTIRYVRAHVTSIQCVTSLVADIFQKARSFYRLINDSAVIYARGKLSRTNGRLSHVSMPAHRHSENFVLLADATSLERDISRIKRETSRSAFRIPSRISYQQHPSVFPSLPSIYVPLIARRGAR